MKRQYLLNLLTALISLIGVNAYAHDIAVENGGKTIYYNFINNNTELEVTYKGVMIYGQFVNEYAGEIVIPASVTYESKTYPVTEIKSQAFKSSSVSSVTIPNGVTYIGAYAFELCKNLTSVTIPNSVTSIQFGAFSGCSNLTSITIPNSVTEIDDNTFSGCSGLTSITIPNSVTKFDNSALSGCLGLTSLNVESDNTVYDSRGNCNAIIETKSQKLIFGIKNTVIPNTVTCIGEGAFAGSDITSIEIPSNVTKIDGGAFKNCSNLTSVTIPNSVTEIPSNPFPGCSGLTSLNVESGNAVYDSHDNCNAIINTTNKTLICGIKSTTIPNGVTKIGDRAFYGCSGLTSITIPNSVTEIGLSAFDGCTGLTSIEIPSSVTSIGIYSFYNCSNLTSVTVKKENPLTINSSVFSNSANATLYVPVGSKNAYQNAVEWKDFGTIKEGYVGNSFTAKTAEDIDMVFTVLDVDAKTCQVGYLDGNYGKTAVDNYSINGPLTIPETVNGYTVVEIGMYALHDVPMMTSVTIPATVTSIDKSAFDFCTHLTSLELPAGVTTIGDYAFDMCQGLTSVTIPNTVTSIGMCAFEMCTGLTSVTIPSSVISLGWQAFSGCTKLESVRILDGVKSIEGFAFLGCSALTSVTVEAETPLTITGGVGVFSNKANATLYVPAGSKAAYQAAVEWKEFKEIIEIIEPKVSLNMTTATIENGQTLTLKATLTPSDLSDKSVTWKSSNTKVATVTDEGVVKGVKAGTVTITCTSKATGAKATCTVTIAEVKLDKTEAVIEKGNTLTLKATVAPTDLADKTVTWKSSNTKVATVTDAGVVKGVKAGTVTITCTSNSTGAKATCTVTVGYVTLDKSEANLEKDKTLTLKATVYPSSLKDKSVTWTSSDKKIATVSSAGVVKGVKAGTVTITCTSKATKLTATCTVTVGEVKLDKTEAAVEKDKTLTLTATVYPSSLKDKSVTWKSSNTKVATVTSAGKVKGMKAGTATITCTSKATGLTATCTVTVGYVTLDKTTATIEKGNTVTLKATVYPSSLKDKSVTWKSSDTKVASVSSSGKVKGMKAGKVTITCTSKATGLKATSTVTVVNGTVKLDKTEVYVQKDNTLTLKATVTPTSLKDKSVTWKSSNTKVATVTSKGKVKGVNYGTATITCTSKATGVKATCKVIVGKVIIGVSEISLKRSRSVTLDVTVYPTDLADKSVTWTSSNTKVATVTAGGKVTGVKAGTATITCTSKATGLKGTCTVTVLQTMGSLTKDGDEIDMATDINEIEEPAVIEPFDVYDLSGRKVLHQVTSLDGLPRGIYIVNGKKILKK